jgi:hypothetical protein
MCLLLRGCTVQLTKQRNAETLTSYQKNFPLHNLAGIFDAIEEAKKEEVAARAAEKEATKKVLFSYLGRSVAAAAFYPLHTHARRSRRRRSRPTAPLSRTSSASSPCPPSRRPRRPPPSPSWPACWARPPWPDFRIQCMHETTLYIVRRSWQEGAANGDALHAASAACMPCPRCSLLRATPSAG